MINPKIDVITRICDIRPENIETFTETYTPEGGEEQTVIYKRVSDHPILNGIKDKLAFFVTHAGAVWYNKQANRTVADEIEDLNANTTFSTEEQVIGTWIDGKPLYRKVISTPINWSAVNQTIPHGISDLRYVTNLTVFLNNYLLPYFSNGTATTYVSVINKNAITVINTNTWLEYRLNAIIEYTKADS